MPLLLEDQFAPITSELGFLETSHDIAARAFIEWQQPIQAARGVRLTERVIQGGLTNVISSLLPLTSVEDRRFLFIPTVGSWTLYLSNGYRGTDATGPMLVLGEQIGCRSIRVVAIPEVDDIQKFQWDRPGASILEVYGPQALGTWSTIRTIYTMRDGSKWKFRQWGTPFPFEDMERYKGGRVQSRFNMELLEHYLNELGIRAFESSFYLPQNLPSALLIEKQGAFAGNARSFTLEEARKAK